MQERKIRGAGGGEAASRGFVKAEAAVGRWLVLLTSVGVQRDSLKLKELHSARDISPSVPAMESKGLAGSRRPPRQPLCGEGAASWPSAEALQPCRGLWEGAGCSPSSQEAQSYGCASWTLTRTLQDGHTWQPFPHGGSKTLLLPPNTRSHPTWGSSVPLKPKYAFGVRQTDRTCTGKRVTRLGPRN